MRMIKKLSHEIKGNIYGAKEKIETAYKLRDTDRAIADWYKDMALAHMQFNNTGHTLVSRQIAEARESMKDNPLLPGMIAVYDDMHSDIMAEAAEVHGMISAYK